MYTNPQDRSRSSAASSRTSPSSSYKTTRSTPSTACRPSWLSCWSGTSWPRSRQPSTTRIPGQGTSVGCSRGRGSSRTSQHPRTKERRARRNQPKTRGRARRRLPDRPARLQPRAPVRPTAHLRKVKNTYKSTKRRQQKSFLFRNLNKHI